MEWKLISQEQPKFWTVGDKEENDAYKFLVYTKYDKIVIASLQQWDIDLEEKPKWYKDDRDSTDITEDVIAWIDILDGLKLSLNKELEEKTEK